MQGLEYQLEKLNDKIATLEKTEPIPQFAEFEGAEFSESFKELGLMAVGGAVSPIASSLINKWIPVGNLGSALVGLGLKFIVKSNPTVQNIANGMIVSSLSSFVGNLMQGKLGFSEGDEDMPAFSEARVGGVNFG